MAGNILKSELYKCNICLQILIEPVVLPCKHEMCRPCFRRNVEEGNFLCPMCRKRISSWARKCIREGTLVDQNRWNLIQKLFPDRCLKRLNGDDDQSDDESYQPPPKRVLAKSGELKQEYEQEIDKILKVHEEEEQASNELIKNILEEEQDLQLQQENQKNDDEQLARKLSEEGTPNVALRPTKSKDLKRKKINNAGRSYTLDRYFLPKEKHSQNLSTSETNNSVPDEERFKSDYELAMALQKQFDREAVAAEKRDDYMLRKSTSGSHNEHACTQEKQQRKSGELERNTHRNGRTDTRHGHTHTRNEHTDTRSEQVQISDKLVQVDGENSGSDEEEVNESEGMQRLCDHTISTGSIKLDVRKGNNHEL